MTDGMTVRLHRHLPDQAQVVGFSYGLGEEQASYLLSEARVEGLALEAVEAAELSAVLNSGEFQARCGGSLRWLQGLDLLGELQLEGPTLVLAAGHGTLREALDALTASRLESIDVEAAEVLFTDGLGASYTGSRRMQQFIREHYGHTWLVWSHDAVHPDEEVAEEDKGWGGHARQGGGFTLRRKYPDAPSKPRHASPTGARMYNR
ncbi:expressed protein [Chlorella variabilis]|uniref:Expressed protein n=1 Tax=Chlorella variabilis TaxID=554065 RepID=E1ZUH9_CHLVA|nr:expressed protein [Chlorella variabilis]EFN50516.1 expressed protein [Chlorella variabilis]|eukprot:XP_005842648.1 expressed protein [Chlorella variabilis]